MSVLNDAAAFRKALFGLRVSRATAALPQTTQSALFTVTGGRILLTSIVGQVTTVIQTQANATKLVSNPTTGTDVDLCATLDITADQVGCLYGITGTLATAMVGANAGATVVQANALVIPVGTIDLSCAASNTGSVSWTLTYVPLDDGASVSAA
jgi:hypothetical protein